MHNKFNMYEIKPDDNSIEEREIQRTVFSWNRRGIFIIISVLFVIALIMLGIFFNPFSDSNLQKESVPEGVIFLSLSPLPEGDNPISIYTLDIATKKIKPFIKADKDKQEEYWTSSLSPDGEYVTFASLPYVEGLSKLFIMKSKGVNKNEISLDMNFTTLRNPVWAPDGESIVFMGLTDAEANIYYTTNWLIYKVDLLTNNQNVITTGVNPLFTPEGDLLVLKDDGLYLFSKNDNFQTSERVWDVVGGRSFSNMKLSISDDGKFLIWTVPQENKVLLFEVTSQNPFRAYIKLELPVTAFWSVFSPNGKFFALQEVDVDENQEEVNARLVIYGVDNSEEIDRFDLSGYFQGSLFVSDWY